MFQHTNAYICGLVALTASIVRNLEAFKSFAAVRRVSWVHLFTTEFGRPLTRAEKQPFRFKCEDNSQLLYFSFGFSWVWNIYDDWIPCYLIINSIGLYYYYIYLLIIYLNKLCDEILGPKNWKHKEDIGELWIDVRHRRFLGRYLLGHNSDTNQLGNQTERNQKEKQVAFLAKNKAPEGLGQIRFTLWNMASLVLSLPKGEHLAVCIFRRRSSHSGLRELRRQQPANLYTIRRSSQKNRQKTKARTEVEHYKKEETS